MHLRRTALSCLVAAALVGPTALDASGSTSPTPIAFPALTFLHVAKPSTPLGLPRIVDATGRDVLLRGVNINGLEDYWSTSPDHLAPAYPIDPAAYANNQCPARNAGVESMTVCWFDAEELHAFGYDAVRLAVSWSLLEPTPGHISETYIDRIAQVVGWLRAQGIYSIIDMHQDAWSKYVYPFGVGVAFPSRVTYTDRAYPMRLAGQLRALRYAAASASFTLRGTSPRVAVGDQAKAAVVFIPARVTGAVRVHGAAVQVYDAGSGNRLAYVYPHGGEYAVMT